MYLVFPVDCSVVVTGLCFWSPWPCVPSQLAMTQKQGKMVACFAQTGRKWTFEHLTFEHLTVLSAFCNHSMKLRSGLFKVQKVTTVIQMSDKSALPLYQRPPLVFCFFFF